MKLLLALLLQAPAPSEPPPEAAEGPWIPVDGVAAQAGDRIVTMSNLTTFLQTKIGERSISTQEELDQEFANALEARVTMMLESQAGLNLGFDKDQLKRILLLEEKEKRQNLGAVGFADYLEGRGLDGLSANEAQTDEFSVYFWRTKVSGSQGLFGSRPVRDNYVRPGELKSLYRKNERDLGIPTQVRFQVFEMPSAAAGGPEAAKEICESVRQRVLDGEEFEDLMVEYGVFPRESRGITPALVLHELPDEELRAFGAKAEIGDLSEALPFQNPNGVEGFVVAKLEARREGSPPPPFSDRRVQDFLRFEYLKKQRDALLDQARGKLRRDSFLWVHPRFGPQEVPKARQVPRRAPQR